MSRKLDFPRPSRLQPLPNTPGGHSDISVDLPPPCTLSKEDPLFFLQRGGSLENSFNFRVSTGGFTVENVRSVSSHVGFKHSAPLGSRDMFEGGRRISSHDSYPLQAALEKDGDEHFQGGEGKRGKKVRKKKSQSGPEEGSEREMNRHSSTDIKPSRRSQAKGKTREGEEGRRISTAMNDVPKRSKNNAIRGDEEEKILHELEKRTRALVEGRKKMSVEVKQTEKIRHPKFDVERAYPSFDKINNTSTNSIPSAQQHKVKKNEKDSKSSSNLKMDGNFSSPPPSSFSSLTSPGSTDRAFSHNSASVHAQRKHRDGTRKKTKEKQTTKEVNDNLGKGTYGYFAETKTSTAPAPPFLEVTRTAPRATQTSHSLSNSEKNTNNHVHSSSSKLSHDNARVRGGVMTTEKNRVTHLPASSGSIQGSEGFGPSTSSVRSEEPQTTAILSLGHGRLHRGVVGSSPTINRTSSSTTSSNSSMTGASLDQKPNPLTSGFRPSGVSRNTTSLASTSKEVLEMSQNTEALRLEAHRRSNAISSNVTGNWRRRTKMACGNNAGEYSNCDTRSIVTKAFSPSSSAAATGSRNSYVSDSTAPLQKKKVKTLPTPTKRANEERENRGAEDDDKEGDESLPEAPPISSYTNNPSNWSKYLSSTVISILNGRELEPPFTTHLWKQAYPHPETEIDAQDMYDAHCERDNIFWQEDTPQPNGTTSTSSSPATDGTSAAASLGKVAECARSGGKPLSNPHVHQYDRKLCNGYYACVRCKTPICSPKFQVRNEEKGIAVFQYLNPDGVRVEVDISGAFSLSHANSCTSSPLQRHQSSSYPSHFFLNANANRRPSPEPRTRRVDPYCLHMWNATSQLHCLAFCSNCNGCLGVCTLDIPVSMLDRVDSGELFYVNSCCLVYQPYRTNASLKGTIVGDIARIEKSGAGSSNARKGANPSSLIPSFCRTSAASQKGVNMTTSHWGCAENMDDLDILADNDFGLGIEDFDSDDGEGARKPEVEFPSDEGEFGFVEDRNTSGH